MTQLNISPTVMETKSTSNNMNNTSSSYHRKSKDLMSLFTTLLNVMIQIPQAEKPMTLHKAVISIIEKYLNVPTKP